MQWRRSSSIIAVSSLIGIIVCLIICGICEFVWKFILYIK